MSIEKSLYFIKSTTKNGTMEQAGAMVLYLKVLFI